MIWRGLRTQFAEVGIQTAEMDARLLVAWVLELTDLELITSEAEPVSQKDAQQIVDIANRRLSGEPVARILGHKEFYGLEFELNAHTLVPRPETEMLVDLGLAHLDGLEKVRRAPAKLLDLGTGTGCLPIAMLVHVPKLYTVATDLSAEALVQAKHNAAKHGVDQRVSFLQGSWFDPIQNDPDFARMRFDLIVSNPPYISSKVCDTLQVEVKDFDPLLALDGGADGLDAYRQIIASALPHLGPHGALLLEIGFDQGELVQQMCFAAGYEQVEIKTDLSGHARVIVAVPGRTN